jgi:predicted Zn-dependent protease
MARISRRRPPVAFGRGPTRRSSKLRFVIALAIALFAVFSYLGKRSENPVTGESQYVDLTPGQEIALGLQAAPEMARQHGGLHPDQQTRSLVDRVGQRLVSRTAARATPYEFDFHLLADSQTINAFALPGGQVFITAALLGRLETEGQLAGVLGHEIGHVVARHGAEHMAKAKLTQGLTGAAVLATYDPSSASGRQTAAIAAMIGQLINMKYGRDDELESDRLGVRFTASAGYDPRAMIRVMEILAQASEGARPPEFFSTHPNPDRRIQRIEEAIREQFSGGAPAALEP